MEGNYIFWENWRREIFIDLDGTLTKPIQEMLSLPTQNYSAITADRPSLEVDDHCFSINGSIWDESIYCDQ